MGFYVCQESEDFVRIKHAQDGIETLCSEVYVLKGHTLVDLGSPRHAEELLSFLDSAAIPPENITDIFFTHTHIDHVGYPHYFRNAAVYLHSWALEWLRQDPNAALNKGFEHNGLTVKKEAESFMDLFSADRFSLKTLDACGIAHPRDLDSFVNERQDGICYTVTQGHTPCDVSFSYQGYFMIGDCVSPQKPLAFPKRMGVETSRSLAHRLLRQVPRDRIFTGHGKLLKP